MTQIATHPSHVEHGIVTVKSDTLGAVRKEVAFKRLFKSKPTVMLAWGDSVSVGRFFDMAIGNAYQATATGFTIEVNCTNVYNNTNWSINWIAIGD